MATINATATISSDIASYPITLSSTMTMTKSANPNVGLEETTGLRTKKFTSDTAAVIVEADELTADKAHKVAATAETIGKLYGGDWMLFPYNGSTNITVASSSTTETQMLEYMVFADGIVADKG